MSNNDLIAQFMGIEVKMDMMGNENPDYMTWNELMPVCIKIRKTTPYNSYLAIETTSIFVTIEDVYKAVVEFIERYNKPNKMEVEE